MVTERYESEDKKEEAKKYQYECLDCNKVYASLNRFKMHIMSSQHYQKDQLPFCKKCGDRFFKVSDHTPEICQAV